MKLFLYLLFSPFLFCLMFAVILIDSKDIKEAWEGAVDIVFALFNYFNQ